MPLSAQLTPSAASPPRLSSLAARVLSIAIGVPVALVDFLTPGDYNVALFYLLAIATCAWSASRRFVWGSTAVFTALAFVAIVVRPPLRQDWSTTAANRALATLAMLTAAALVDRWIHNSTSLREQRNASTQILQSLDLAQVIIRRLDGTILFWSHGAEMLYGWSAGDARNRVTHELLETRFGRESLEEINRRLEQNGEWFGELLHARKDGTTIWVASHWTLHPGERFGSPVVTEVNNEITELKRAESRYRELTEVSPDLVWQLSPAGDTTYVNQRWREYFGREPIDVNMTRATEFIHPDDLTQASARWQNANRTGHVQPWEARYRRYDGEYRWFSGRGAAVRNEAGEIMYWIATATDIQDEKNLEERLRETQKLEAIGRLTGHVAHDFNNLLTAINGYNTLVREEVAGNASALDYSSEIDKASARATALTRQLLTFSRPQPAKPRSLNLNDVVTDLSKILGRVIGEDIRLEVRLAPALPNVVADPVQVDQIIMNLAVNSRDAMPDGGTLQLQTRVVRLGADLARARRVALGDYVVMSVRDSGTGIDEATRARLFEPFFTTKERGKGTGLGLSIVSGIVSHAGGFIHVESVPGEGAEFAIHLPASQVRHTVETTAPAEPERRHGHGTILLVEDEDPVRRLVRDVLRARGYTILEAATPLAALDLARDHRGRIDLLISDVLMPEMRGPELVERVRGLMPSIRVLYISGYTDSTFLDAGALEDAAYLQKPFVPAVLADAVASALEKTPRPV